MEDEHTSKKKIVIAVLLAIAVAIAVACATCFVADYLRYRDTQGLGGSAQTASSVSGRPAVTVPINFEELATVNEDIYAWIRIPDKNNPGEPIADYPIVQSAPTEDRDYYLTHNINRLSSDYGSIYTQRGYNGKDFGDFNTVVYGHNMRNGTMFGSLRQYRDATFFKENTDILVYMPGRVLRYRIFAAYVTDDRHILATYNNQNTLHREQYLDEIFAERTLTANIDRSVPVTVNDRIITLSTCTARDGERYLVQGVLVYDSDTQ